MKEIKLILKHKLEKPFPDAEAFWMTTVENENCDYVGDLKWGEILLKYGIVPELIKGNSGNVCQIGKSLKDGKWYGWSHRAIFGFKIGDKVKKGDCTNSSGYTEEYLKENPGKDTSLGIGFEAKTEADTKKMAIAFADSVS